MTGDVVAHPAGKLDAPKADVELERLILTAELDLVLLRLGALLGTSAMGALVAGRVLRAQHIIIGWPLT